MSDPALVVHVLHEGHPLCGFLTNLPVDWPAHHKWVSIKDREHATCAPCLRAAAHILYERRK